MRKHVAILVLVGFLVYLPSLFGPFVWDDEDFVYANSYVANFQVDKFFTASITEGRNKGSNYFRPIQEIAYATTHAVFGFNPFWFHLLNVLAHICAACAIFYFFTLLLKQIKNGVGIFSQPKGKADTAPVPVKAALGEKNIPSHFLLSIPFLISLVFLIHPIQTEAVSYISGLSDPLYVLFGFLSLIFYLLKDERKNMIPLSLFFFILSILSKETGLVFLPILILMSAIQQTNHLTIKNLWKFVANSWKSLFAYLVTALLYLWYHFTFINTFDIKAAWGNNPYANSVLVRLLTFVQNQFLYVQLLIFPKDLFMERDYSIPIQTHFLNPYLIIFVAFNALILFGIWKLRNSLPIAHCKLLIFTYLAFFVSLLPYTGIVLINGIFYEHFLYLPMIFFFSFVMFTAVEISHLLKFTFPRNLLLLTLFILFVLLSLRTVQREFDWTDSIRFYSQTLEHAPKSIRIINGLGMAYADKGNLDQAIKEYSLIPPINPNIPNAYHNLANAYAAKGDIHNAEKYYLKALEVDPNFLFSFQSLANLYQQTGQKDKLQKLIEKYQTR